MSKEVAMQSNTGRQEIISDDSAAQMEQRWANEVFDERRRRLINLLGWSGLVLFVLGGFFTGRVFLSDPNGRVKPLLLLTFAVGIIAMALVLRLTRRKDTNRAAFILVYSYSAIIAVGVLFGSDSAPEQVWPTIALFYLVTMWAGLLLPPINAFVIATLGCSLYYLTAAFLLIPSDSSPSGILALPSYFVERAREIDIRLLLVYYGIAFASLFFSTTVQRLTSRLTERAINLSQANQLIAQQASERIETATAVQALAQQVASASAEQLASVTEQHSVVQTISGAMAELDQASVHIAGLASSAANFNNEAQQEVASGGATIGHALDAFSRLDSSVHQIGDYIADLERRARDIQGIANEMSNIAEEIQLLALNATIEATGAGEMGRRFTVIASSVSHLADNAQSAVERSRSIVIDLLRATSTVVQASGQGRLVAEQGTSLTRQATDANHRISAMVAQAAAQVQAISLSTGQQRDAAQQAVVMLRELNASAAQSENTSRITNDIAEQLRQIAVSLRPAD